MCGCESKEAWFDWKQNKITKCSGFECQMPVRPYQTSFHLSSQCCACRTDNDNPVDLENDIRHDVPSARSQSTWNHMYILYRTESLGPEKGLVKGGPGPSCTENRGRIIKRQTPRIHRSRQEEETSDNWDNITKQWGHTMHARHKK